MEIWSTVVVIPTIILGTIGSHVHAESKTGIFNVLLGLYKLNPLKESDLYSAFADNLLHGIVKKQIKYDKDHQLYQLDLSTIKNHSKLLKELERLIRSKIYKPKRLHKIYIDKPKLDIDDINFDDIILQKDDDDKDNEIDLEDYSTDDSWYSTAEMEANRRTYKHRTELIPIKDFIITRKLMNTVLFPKLRDNKYKIDTWEYEIGNNDLDTILYSDDRDSSPNIIVF